MVRTLIVLACLLLAPALAADVYTGTAPVEGQGEAERRAAFPDAFRQVLEKLSGLRALPEDPAVEDALAGAERSVVSFSYRETEQRAPDGTPMPALELAVAFLPTDVDRIAAALGLPRWPTDRRALLAVVIVDEGAGRRLMPVEYEAAYEAMRQVAERRGLDLAWPDIDPEAVDPVSVQLLWGGFTEPAEPWAGEGRDLLIAAARREAASWSVRWTLSGARQVENWRDRALDLESALLEGAHAAVDRIAAAGRIAATDLGTAQRRIVVSGVRSPGDYARVLAYLQGLALVSEVRVESAEPGRLRFDLTLNAAPEYFDDAVAGAGVLQAGVEPGAFTLLP